MDEECVISLVANNFHRFFDTVTATTRHRYSSRRGFISEDSFVQVEDSDAPSNVNQQTLFLGTDPVGQESIFLQKRGVTDTTSPPPSLKGGGKGPRPPPSLKGGGKGPPTAV